MKGTDGAESINMSSYEVGGDAALLGDVSDFESLSPKVSVLLQRTLKETSREKQVTKLNVQMIFRSDAVISERTEKR